MGATSLAATMAEDALEAQRFSRKHLVLELNYSAESIDALEEHADSIEYALAGGKSAENVRLLVQLWGAYLGESIRRSGGGEWASLPDGTPAVCRRDRTLNPHEQIKKRLLNGSSFNLSVYHRQAIEE